MDKLSKKRRGAIQRALIADSGGQRKRIKPPQSFPAEETHGFQATFGKCDYASEEEEEAAMAAYQAAMDTGCTSHVIVKESLPKDTKIDFSRAINVQTAKNGDGMWAQGRADAGLLTECLVVDDGIAPTSLISISAFDRKGCTSLFANGKGIITDKQGEVIAEANLLAHFWREEDGLY